MEKAISENKATRKFRILSKPNPARSERARQNGVEGEVVVRAVFAASGEVTDIVPIKELPDGLTELAIAAAREIKFEPSLKDGCPMSKHVNICYGFSSEMDQKLSAS